MKYETALAMLGEALDDPHPTVTVAELNRELVTPGGATLWMGERSVVFLRTVEFDSGARVMEAAPAAGDLEEILSHGVAAVEAFARERGCTQVHVQAGRSGWARALKQHGYEEVAVLLRKVID